MCFRKTHVHEDVVQGVNTAGNDHIASAGRQFHGRKMDGAHRTGTGGINRTIGSAQVETVGYSPGNDIAQESRK